MKERRLFLVDENVILPDGRVGRVAFASRDPRCVPVRTPRGFFTLPYGVEHVRHEDEPFSPAEIERIVTHGSRLFDACTRHLWLMSTGTTSTRKQP